MTPRDTIGSHVCNDRHELYAFVRDTRLPAGYFDNPWRITPNRVLWALTILAAALLVACV
jgi:hypothetical protein